MAPAGLRVSRWPCDGQLTPFMFIPSLTHSPYTTLIQAFVLDSGLGEISQAKRPLPQSGLLTLRSSRNDSINISVVGLKWLNEFLRAFTDFQ